MEDNAAVYEVKKSIFFSFGMREKAKKQEKWKMFFSKHSTKVLEN